MEIVGKCKEREVIFNAGENLLREGALLNAELLKLQAVFRFLRGVFRYESHEGAGRHVMDRAVLQRAIDAAK